MFVTLCYLHTYFLKIYINDLPVNLSSTVRFTDDCSIYCNIKCFSDNNSILQNDLDITYWWCLTWQMSHNAWKCKLTLFIWKRTDSVFHYSIKSTLVSTTALNKHLALHLSSDSSRAMHIAAVSSKASESLGCLHRNLCNAPFNVRRLACVTYVRPQLQYASFICLPCQDYLIRNSGNYEYYSSITQIKKDLAFQ